ncbi:MAG: L-threonylcarbamoyladenylate synthase [Caldimicrobium sp.]
MIFKIKENSQNLDNVLKEVALLLKKGKVGAIPTETFYGLSANPFSEEALKRLFYLKKREPDKPILLLLSSLDDLTRVCARIPGIALKLIKAFWPGPLTLVLPAKRGLSSLLTAGTNTIGVRLSSCELTRKIARAFGGPITGTSANISGRPPCKTAEEVLREIPEIDFVVDAGETKGDKPSTVIEILEKDIRLIREGAIAFEEIMRIVGEKKGEV